MPPSHSSSEAHSQTQVVVEMQCSKSEQDTQYVQTVSINIVSQNVVTVR